MTEIEVKSDNYNNKVATKFIAEPLDDPFFINLTIERRIDGLVPHNFPKNITMDLLSAQELSTVLDGAIQSAKNDMERQRDVAYEGWKAVEDELLSHGSE